MDMETRDNKLTTGGRVSLNREVLISLRREQGLSQELVALMCAEQRLCVSIASIKRAETGKNILYRTARDISTFFDVDISDIIDTASDQATQQTISKDASNTAQIPVSIAARRQIVVLVADLLIRQQSPAGVDKYWKSTCESAARRFDAELHPLGDTRCMFLFGSHVLMGYEHFQALHCAKWLQGQMHSMLDHAGVVHGFVSYQQILPHDDSTGADDAAVNAMFERMNMDVYGSDQVDNDMLVVNESVKQGLESRFLLTPYQGDGSVTGEGLWQINEGDSPASEVKRFIGRELQFQQFKAAVESVFAYNEMQVIYIRGMAGIGKTRLLEEFCDYASGLGVEYHKAHVLDFGAEQNQTAIPKLIRSILKLSADENNLGYEQLNQRCGHKVCDQQDLSFLYSWLGWPLSGKALSLYKAMNHETRSAGLQRVVENLIRNTTQKTPLLLCIEDLHWANDDLLESIQRLAEALKDTQVILLMTSRKENDPLQKKWSSAWIDVPMLVMNLSPLRDSEAHQFADYFDHVSAEYKQLCIERAEGNPLFLEQLLRDNKLELESLPQTVQTLVLSRLDSLSAQCRTAARAASVLGQWFTKEALNNVLQSDDFNIEPLIEHYLVKRSGDRLQFVHALVHQGVYQTITDEARIELHQRCAQWFETIDKSLQARHLNRARVEQAADVYIQAIRARIDENNFDDAMSLIDEAFEITYARVNKSILWLLKAHAMLAQGNTEQAVACYQGAVTEAQTDSEKFEPLIGLAGGLDTLERYEEALAALAQAELCVSTDQINRELSQIHYLRGNFYFPKGQVDDCRQEHSKALNYARLAQDSNAEAKALGGLGDAAYAQGKMVTACNYFMQCLELCSCFDLAQVEAANRFMLGTTRIYLNETEQALQDALDSADLAETVGHKRAEIVSRLTAGWILLDMQELEQAREQSEHGLALACEIGARRFEPFLQESLARYHYYRGDSDSAQATIAKAYSEIQQQEIEGFIGPWIISTYALITADANQAKELLHIGTDWLQQNCIGHNYYRFYVNAIESALLNKDWSALDQYINAFQAYTKDEPSPWSDYYLSRGKLISRAWQQPPEKSLLAELETLKARGEQAHLNHSLDLITQAITHQQPGQASR